MKIQSSFTPPHVVSKVFFSFTEYRGIYFKECW